MGVVLALCVAAPTAAEGAVCSDYANQRDAQQAADTRDADGDGIYCETLPCPCLKPGQGGGGGGASKPRPIRAPAPQRKPKKKRYVAPREIRGVTVTSVIDGDTVNARTRKGGYLKVRLLGIDAPKSSAVSDSPQCGGDDAAQALEVFRSDYPDVTLVTDPSQRRYDASGRLLAYVQPSGDSEFTTYQTYMLASGRAEVFEPGSRPFRRVGAFVRAGIDGYRARAGVWATCGGNFRRPLGAPVARTATDAEVEAIMTVFAGADEARCNVAVIAPSGLWAAVWSLRDSDCNGGDGVGFAYRPDPASPWQLSDVAGSDLRCDDFPDIGDASQPSRTDMQATGACWS
jgi:endonuclease YncB( thermonuclease family)